jgi:hypothetical protein
VNLSGVFNENSDEPVQMKARKFLSGKEAKKAALQLQAQRDQEYKEYMESEEGQRTQAIFDEHKIKRGPSLMDAHLEKQSAKRPTKEPRRAFDRELVIFSYAIYSTFRTFTCLHSNLYSLFVHIGLAISS